MTTAELRERRALDASTMCEAFQITAAQYADKVALRTLGDAISITFAEYAERVRRLAGGLHELGVRRGDTVGFMLTNRPEFHLLDTAVAHLGATPFSIYNTSSPEQIEFLLGDAGNRVMIVEAGFLDGTSQALANHDRVEHLIVLDGATADSITLGELESAQPGGEFDFDAAWQAVRPDDVLTLIYTSGTTGPPKGVQLTHANQLAESRGLDETMPVEPDDSTISFLPMAHIADRGLTHYGQMVWGSTVSCCPDVTQVFAYVADARPTRFGAVPRVWEKLKAALEAGFAAEPDEARRAAISEALALGIEQGPLRAGRRAGACRAGRGLRARRDRGVRARARAAGPGPLPLLRHRRGPVAAGHVRVLRRDRDPDPRGVGDVGAVQHRHDRARRPDPLRHRGRADRRGGDAPRR